MMNDLRWIITMWFMERALSIAPADDSKRSLLMAIAPWAEFEARKAAERLTAK